MSAFPSFYTSNSYTEQFSNGVTIMGIYLNPLPNSNSPPIESSIFQVMKEVSLLFCLPDNPFFVTGQSNHAVQDAVYACACEFRSCSYFLFEGNQTVAGSLRNTSAIASVPRISLSRMSSMRRTLLMQRF